MMQKPVSMAGMMHDSKSREIRKRLGQTVRSLREQAGMRQTTVAHRIGVSQPTMSRVERGHIDLTLSQVYAYAEALGTTVSDLLAALEGAES